MFPRNSSPYFAGLGCARTRVLSAAWYYFFLVGVRLKRNVLFRKLFEPTSGSVSSSSLSSSSFSFSSFWNSLSVSLSKNSLRVCSLLNCSTSFSRFSSPRDFRASVYSSSSSSLSSKGICLSGTLFMFSASNNSTPSGMSKGSYFVISVKSEVMKSEKSLSRTC
jgi:hypothetical protein